MTSGQSWQTIPELVLSTADRFGDAEASLIRGATIIPVPVFQLETMLELIEHERITMLPGPPTLYHSLLAAQGHRHDLSSLRAAVTGAADIPVELIRRVRSELPFQSIRYVEFRDGLPVNATGKVMKDQLW